MHIPQNRTAALLAAFGCALGPRAAVCVQAALFAVQHGGAAGIAYALVLGVLLGTIRQRTGRVWPGWVLHTVNNLLVFAAG